MPEYTYEALAQTGIRNQGTLVASEREALAMLNARAVPDQDFDQGDRRGADGRQTDQEESSLYLLRPAG